MRTCILSRPLVAGFFFCLLTVGLCGSYSPARAAGIDGVSIVPDEDDALSFRTSAGVVRVCPLADNAVRIVKAGAGADTLPELVYLEGARPEYRLTKAGNKNLMTLKGLTVEVADDGIRFYSPDGRLLLAEAGWSLTPSTVQDEPTYVAEQRFHTAPDECLYGLGQFQDGYLNVRGLSRRLTQVNTQIAVPFLMSSGGYGILWNNYGLTDFNPGTDSVALERSLAGGKVTEVNVTSTTGGVKELRESNVFTAEVDIPVAGAYSLLLDVGSRMARRHHLEIDGRKVIEMNNLWLPPTASVIVDLEAGRHRLTAELTKEDNPVLYYKKVDDTTVFRSPVAGGVDYTFFAGNPDEVIASYRAVTGEVPMQPLWALGYIHCRERFHSQAELLETAARFRREQLPVDLMVQDWQYWGKYGWNAMRFDEEFYPSPKAMTDSLHAQDMRLMLSVWSKVDPASVLGKEFGRRGYYIANTQWVDFFNPQAATFYWDNMRDSLIRPFGIDALWLDATEPENDDLLGRRVGNGARPGEVFRNAYPLTVNKTVYEGLRRDVPGKRVMILTRSAFPGIQRYGVATWSGDVGNDWETFRRQLVAGLGISVCGLPWWTYDAGGFFRPGNGQYSDARYHERFLRWLQTSVYLPLMRVHGYMTDTEFWNYGEDVMRLARKSLDMRYRLLPYIYAGAADVTGEGGTLLRPLVMDFAADTTALRLKYQYMFGQSLLVAPIVEEGPVSWRVYLPEVKGGWYDFHSGAYVAAGGWFDSPVSAEYIPVFARAGSIVPLATATGSTAAALASDYEVRIYAGADGAFRLYEDEGDNYNYEKGQYAEVSLTWDDARRQLTVGDRRGGFEGMKDGRKMKLVLLSAGGQAPAVKEIVYKGKKLTVKF